MTDPAVREPTIATGRTRLGSHAICLDGTGRLLLCRLAPIEVEAGAWTLPGGGVDFGEHPDDACIRELREETGFEGEIERLEAVFSELYPKSRYADGLDLHFLSIMYRVRIVGGLLRDEVDGTTDHAAWMGPDDVRSVRLVSLAKTAVAHVWPGVLE